MTVLRLMIAGLIGLVAGTAHAVADTPVPPPVAAVSDDRLAIGEAQLPIFASQDWSQPLPAIHRAVIVVHGYDRNAADYLRHMMDARPAVDTIVIAPQFLAVEDIAAHLLPAAVLRWKRERWSDGEPAEEPAALSAFDVLDALIARLDDRARFPNLGHIVLAGFSAGGQLVQRYAAVGRGGTAAAVSYVVGSPSSFAYFGEQRPRPVVDCPDVNRWKYVFAGGLPPYVLGAVGQGIPALERRYVARPVTYLVGADDNNPEHRFLDKTCGAEAQGANRLARTIGFFTILRQRDGDNLRQGMHVIAGAAHNAAKVFASPCGRAVLFGEGGCRDTEDQK